MQDDVYYSTYLKDQKKLSDLGNELELYLSKAGINLENLATGQTLDHATEEIQKKIDDLTNKIMQTRNKPELTRLFQEETVNLDHILQSAKALMAQQKWNEAAQLFDEYVKNGPQDWEVHFSRGVAHANSRGGLTSDIAALRAYNDAIALIPAKLDSNNYARLFSYRGAMLKRLRRLDEAEADLTIAQKYATAVYEINNINYNWAGIYALRGERNKLLEVVSKLSNSPKPLHAIQAHLRDYFKDYANDKEFLRAIGIEGDITS